jgi:hypothetical protein
MIKGIQKIKMMFAEDLSDLKLIKEEILMREIDPWDKIILVYLAYLGYANFQIAYYSYKSIVQNLSLSLSEQFYHYFLLMYGFTNIHQSYKYFLFKTNQISPLIARKIYNKFNKYFDFFSDNADNISNYMAMSQNMKNLATNMNDYDIKVNVEIKPKKKYEDSSSDENDDKDDKDDKDDENSDSEENSGSEENNNQKIKEEFKKYYDLNDNLEKMVQDIEKNKIIFEKFKNSNKLNNNKDEEVD